MRTMECSILTILRSMTLPATSTRSGSPTQISAQASLTASSQTKFGRMVLVRDRPGTAWGDLMDAQVTLSIPARESRLFVAQFTALSGCSDLELSNCDVRIAINGV